MSTVAAAVIRYADRFHRAVGAGHHVASPLGAWLLLALVAPASQGPPRDRLAEALGCEIEEAHSFARSLLSQRHPVVSLAVAAWSRTTDAEGLGAWLDSLRGVADVGPMPAQAEADRWTVERTLGLIEELPLRVDDLVFALITALATRISWNSDFDTVGAEALSHPPADGFHASVLLTERSGRVVDSDVGAVGVHTKLSRGLELAVVSVIADPAVEAADVLAVAHPIAVAAVSGRRAARAVPLDELPLGQGHSWTLREVDPGPQSRNPEEFATVLPAWSAEATFDLLQDGAFGCDAALEVIGRWISGPPVAKQVALARYTRTGFEAAAVSMLAVAQSASAEPARVRELTLEFTHPYAVVAVTRGRGPWGGLPVFSGWITRADEA